MCSLHEVMPEKLSAARNRTPSARVRSAPSAKSGRIAGGSVSAKTLSESFGKEKNRLQPTDIGMLVNDYLEQQFAPIIDYMHIKDALFKDGSVVPAGEGDGSVPSILKTLAETGKPYMLTLEPHLYDFSGLQNLQGEDVLHKRVYKDADEAFDVASNALHDILKTIE